MPALSQANCRAGASPANPATDAVALHVYRGEAAPYFFTASAFGALCCA